MFFGPDAVDAIRRYGFWGRERLKSFKLESLESCGDNIKYLLQPLCARLTHGSHVLYDVRLYLGSRPTANRARAPGRVRRRAWN